jgi:hypothetical protein
MFKLIPLSQKNILETQTCWAACIDMVTQPEKEGVQSLVLDKLRDFVKIDEKKKRRDNKRITMPLNKKYFFKLYNDDILDQRGCNHYQFNEFPSQKFIIDKIDKEKSIICNGIFYPLLAANDLHCIVIHGYKVEHYTFWVLTLDPRRTNKTYKVAWIYKKLVDCHNQTLRRDKRVKFTHKMDFVTDIGIGKENSSFVNKKDEFERFKDISLFTYMRPTSISMTKTLVQYIEDQKEEFLIEYFEVFENNPTIVKNGQKLSNYLNNFNPNDENEIDKIPEYETLNDCFENTNQEFGRVYFYPAYIENIVVLEFIFRENIANVFTLIGIQEPLGFQTILEVHYFKDNNSPISTYPLNHQKPNYKIISVPLNGGMYYMSVDIPIENTQGKTYYVPIDNYKCFKKGCGYTIEDIKTMDPPLFLFS